jgi:hypothetical protein
VKTKKLSNNGEREEASIVRRTKHVVNWLLTKIFRRDILMLKKVLPVDGQPLDMVTE